MHFACQVACNTLITSCGRAFQWRRSLQVVYEMVRMQPAAWHRNASQKQMSLLLFSVDLLCELQLAQLALGIELLHSMMFRSGLGDSGCSSHELHHWLSLGKSFAASRGRGFQRYWQRIATPCKKHVGLLATQCTEREREREHAGTQHTPKTCFVPLFLA